MSWCFAIRYLLDSCTFRAQWYVNLIVYLMISLCAFSTDSFEEFSFVILNGLLWFVLALIYPRII